MNPHMMLPGDASAVAGAKLGRQALLAKVGLQTQTLQLLLGGLVGSLLWGRCLVRILCRLCGSGLRRVLGRIGRRLCVVRKGEQNAGQKAADGAWKRVVHGEGPSFGVREVGRWKV